MLGAAIDPGVVSCVTLEGEPSERPRGGPAMNSYVQRLDALEAALRAVGVAVDAGVLDQVARSVQQAIEAGEDQEDAVGRGAMMLLVRVSGQAMKPVVDPGARCF